jgi:hypothetical protein
MLRSLGGVLLNDILADAQCPVPDRARVLRPTYRQQIRQEARDLSEGQQRRIPGRHVGELGCNSIPTKVQNREASRPTHTLTRADGQSADPNWHVAE